MKSDPRHQMFKVIKISIKIDGKQINAIRFLEIEGCREENISIRMQNVYEEISYLHVIVFQWIHKIRNEHDTFQNELHPARPCRHEIGVKFKESEEITLGPCYILLPKI
jgi:hypothetical protein